MKKLFLLLVVLIASFATYWFVFKAKEDVPKGPKQAPLALKKHSEGFNKSVDSVVNAYLAMKDAFVEGDTSLAKAATKNFIGLLNNFPMEEMKKDTALVLASVQAALENIKANANSILDQPNITEMRHDFNMVTETMYPSFFTSINYEGPILYVENCPMAFDDSISAIWISNSAEIVNPYLGKNHPTYKAGMLHCGDVKDSVMAK